MTTSHPTDWTHPSWCGDNLFGLPAGTYAPAVADGFYLLLPPLPPGAHTITLRRHREHLDPRGVRQRTLSG